MLDLDDPTRLVGVDPAGRMLEIGVAQSDGIEFIVHPFPARTKFLEP